MENIVLSSNLLNESQLEVHYDYLRIAFEFVIENNDKVVNTIISPNQTNELITHLAGCLKEINEPIELLSSQNYLLEALQGLMIRYKSLVDSGDCGFWKAEEEIEYITAQSAIEKALK